MAAAADSGIEPQVTQAQSHPPGSKQPSTGSTQLHKGDAVGGETRGEGLSVPRAVTPRTAVKSQRALQVS